MESRMRWNRFIVILRRLLHLLHLLHLHLFLLLLGETRMAHREQDYLSLVETMHRLEKWPAVL
jgi:hypothetical protein